MIGNIIVSLFVGIIILAVAQVKLADRKPWKPKPLTDTQQMAANRKERLRIEELAMALWEDQCDCPAPKTYGAFLRERTAQYAALDDARLLGRKRSIDHRPGATAAINPFITLDAYMSALSPHADTVIRYAPAPGSGVLLSGSAPSPVAYFADSPPPGTIRDLAAWDSPLQPRSSPTLPRPGTPAPH